MGAINGQDRPRKPWYRRRWVWAVAAVFILVGWLSDPDDEDDPAGSSTPTPTATTTAAAQPTTGATGSTTAEPPASAEPTPSPTSAAEQTTAPPATPTETVPDWAAPTDGTWDWGDVSFGERSDLLSWEYVVLIDTPPTVTADGDRVTVSSVVQVFREVDRGFGNPVSDDLSVYFSPGTRDESNRYNEAYGRADFICEAEYPAEGESTTCTATFTTKYRDEVQDFHWDINRQSIGTWPSQIAE